MAERGNHFCASVMSKISVAITRLVTNVLHMPRLRLQQDVEITFISHKWLRFFIPARHDRHLRRLFVTGMSLFCDAALDKGKYRMCSSAVCHTVSVKSLYAIHVLYSLIISL